MTLRRGLIALLLATCAVFATAGPASAHTSLRSSDPADGATLTTRPTQVSLTFGEAVTVRGNPIRITGSGGAAWTVGRASVTDATVSAPVTPTGPAGVYNLSWTVVSSDGDTLSGKITFTVRGAAEPQPGSVAPRPAPAAAPAAPATSADAATEADTSTEPAPAAVQTSDSGGGVPWWVWIVGAAVVLAGVGGAVAARRRGVIAANRASSHRRGTPAGRPHGHRKADVQGRR